MTDAIPDARSAPALRITTFGKCLKYVNHKFKSDSIQLPINETQKLARKRIDEKMPMKNKNEK